MNNIILFMCSHFAWNRIKRKNKNIWKASKEKENKKVVKLLFIGSICECIDLISFGRVSDNRTSHIFESWAQARSQAGFGIWLPKKNRKSMWSRANTAQGTLCWGSDQLLWFMVSAAYTSLFWASKNTTVSQKTKKYATQSPHFNLLLKVCHFLCW